MEEQRALIAQYSALSFTDISACACGMTLSASGEKYTKVAANKTPRMFPRKHMGSFQKFFAPISGISEIKPVNSFISNITIAKIPRENKIEPISLPQVAYKLQASKNAVPPTPIITPEQKDIKQKDANCAFVNFSIGFIKLHRPNSFFMGSHNASLYDYNANFQKKQADRAKIVNFEKKYWFVIYYARTSFSKTANKA